MLDSDGPVPFTGTAKVLNCWTNEDLFLWQWIKTAIVCGLSMKKTGIFRESLYAAHSSLIKLHCACDVRLSVAYQLLF